MVSDSNSTTCICEKSSRSRYLPLLLLAFATLVATVYLFSTVRESEQRQLRNQFERAAEKRINLLRQEHEQHFMKLRSLAALHAASREFSRAQFKTYVELFSPGLTDIQAYEWVPRVTQAERLQVAASVRQQGFPEFQIQERSPQGELQRAGERVEYYPVTFVEPFEGNEAVLGFDLASDPVRRKALYQARDTGELAVTSNIILVQNDGAQSGFFAVYPVYQQRTFPWTVENRRVHLEGFFLGLFNRRQIVQDALADVDPLGIDIHLFDPLAPAGQRLRMFYPSRTWSVAPAATADEAVLRSGIYYEQSFTIATQRMLVICTPSPEFLAGGQTWRAWVLLVAGLSFSGLILAYVYIQIEHVALAQMFAAAQTRAKQALEHEVEERRAAECQLREANRELEAFVYTVSHDLRSPLTPIIGFAEFVRDNYRDRLDDVAIDALTEIESQGDRMATLMEDLLTLAKVGHVERPAVAVDVNAVVQKVLHDLQSRMVTAKVAVQAGPMPAVRVPESLLSQIFDNLIGNAVRYGIRGDGGESGTVEVGGERSGETVRFFVRDHGQGIPAAEHERIFEVFYRGSTGSATQGTGVGLATVRKIAKIYGGQAWVQETLEGGSTFWVELQDG